ncbi:MAG: hypothetical protein LBQ11_02765 [Candidatus Nomurabacteria bacterium]|jgi:hypothetical protein|nr:hypothetical protein [Candidatus Nomurabacteria bacterium]
MKKSDWALILLIVGVVAVVSWFVIGSILPPPSDETVKTAPSIVAEVAVPENNVILYGEDKPNWCSIEDKQYINTVFNICAINSSFYTTTE